MASLKDSREFPLGLDFSQPKQSVRNLIIRSLSKNWPSNARQLHSRLKSEYGVRFTYQAVHKTLRLLAEEGVVLQKDRKYELSHGWLKELKNQAEAIERQYSGESASLDYIRAGTGVSSNPNPAAAGREAARQALAELSSPPTFAFVFCHGRTYGKSDGEILRLASAVDGELRKKNPSCKWVGCTTDGEISDKGCFFNSCSVLVLSSEHLYFGVGVADNASKNFHAAGESAAQASVKDLGSFDPILEKYLHFIASKRRSPSELMKTRPYILLTIFPGPSKTYAPDEDALLAGIQSEVGLLPLFGGSSSDSAVFRQTYQFANGRVYKDACILTTLASDLKIAFSIRHGLRPTKKTALVTKSAGNRVFTLSNKPAAKVYAKMLGLTVPELKKRLYDVVVQKPFGVADPLGHYWLKTPFIVNSDQSLSFLTAFRSTLY